MSKLLFGVLLLGGTLFWWGRQPLPESGFLYTRGEGREVWRIQGTFKRSLVKEDVASRVVMDWEGDSLRFCDCAAITPFNAIEGEPLGICFFDHDGDTSGFLPLSPDLLARIESVRDDGEGSLFLKERSSDREIRFSTEDVDIRWPSEE